MSMALPPGEEAATIPISSRPAFAKPRQPQFQPPPRSPKGVPLEELLGVCGTHLELLGQLLSGSTAVSPDVASTAWSRSIETLTGALLDTRLPKAPEAPLPLNETESPVSSGVIAKGRACRSHEDDLAYGISSRTQMVAILAEAEKDGEQSISDVLARGTTISHLWGSPSDYWFVEQVRVLMGKKRVQAFWMLCIVLNTVNMIIEEQYYGSLVGHRLGVYSEMGSSNDPAFEFALQVVEIVFAFIFTVEVALLLIAMKSLFWHDWKCVLDFSVVVLTDLAIILDGFVHVAVNIQVFRIIRLTKMFRLFKLFSNAEQMESVMIMAAALRRCVASAFWAIAILFASLSVFALIIASIVRDRYLSEDSSLTREQQLETYEYFGSYTRSMLSMFELALANWTPISRFLMENVYEWWMLFAILFKLTIGFAMIGILNSVFMQETFSATELDNDIMVAKKRRADAAHRKKMTDLFEHADTNRDGRVGRREFARMLREPAIRTWLTSMNLDISDGTLLFDLIDAGRDQDGKIDKEELIAGIARLRGPARSVDIKALRMRLEAE